MRTQTNETGLGKPKGKETLIRKPHLTGKEEKYHGSRAARNNMEIMALAIKAL